MADNKVSGLRQKNCCGWQPITTVLPNFLRVNAQMCKLDKQKTRQGAKRYRQYGWNGNTNLK